MKVIHLLRPRYGMYVKAVLCFSCIYTLSVLLQSRTEPRPMSLQVTSELRVPGNEKKPGFQLNWINHNTNVKFAENQLSEGHSQEIDISVSLDRSSSNQIENQIRRNDNDTTKIASYAWPGAVAEKSNPHRTHVKHLMDEFPQYSKKFHQDVLSDRQYATEHFAKFGPLQERFLFILRHYEQLGMATNNLITAASLAKYGNRQLVMPFVNNSRMSGLPQGLTRVVTDSQSKVFTNLSYYFDVDYLNRTLSEHGYSTLAKYERFVNSCNHYLDVMVHFLYTDKSAIENAKKWYRSNNQELKGVYARIKANEGWTSCDFIRRAEIGKLMGNFKIGRYYCVHPDYIKTTEELEAKVLRGKNCVGIVHWKGNGTDRTHFQPAFTIREQLRPSDFRHSAHLIQKASDFVKYYIRKPFIAIQVRAERHLLRKTLDTVLRCIRRLSRKVLERQRTFSVDKIFLATDLLKHGSDTLQKNTRERDRVIIHDFLKEVLKSPVIYRPELFNNYDRGEIAVIEMHILSYGESLYTLGGGNFQEWVIDTFLYKNAEDKTLVHRVCELR